MLLHTQRQINGFDLCLTDGWGDFVRQRWVRDTCRCTWAWRLTLKDDRVQLMEGWMFLDVASAFFSHLSALITVSAAALHLHLLHLLSDERWEVSFKRCVLFKQFDPLAPPLLSCCLMAMTRKWSGVFLGVSPSLRWSVRLGAQQPLWSKSKEKTSVFLIHVTEESRHTELLQVDSVTHIKVEVTGRW